MIRVLVWDLPIRLIHWLLTVGFIAAAIIALLLDDDSTLFPYHAIIGLTIALLVCLRVIWGLVGTRYARFGTFTFGPGAVIEYMKGTLLGGGKRYIGHNPGAAYAIFAMLALVLGLAITGLMMGQGNESVKDLHSVLSYATVGIVIVHVLGVALHTIRHRENIVASMIHGKKNAEAVDAIGSPHALVAVVFLVICSVWTVGLIRNYDRATQTTRLPLFGTLVQLGEAEDEGGTRRPGKNHETGDD